MQIRRLLSPRLSLAPMADQSLLHIGNQWDNISALCLDALLKFGTAQALRFVADISYQLPSEIEMEDLYDSFWGSSSMVTSLVYWRCNIVRVTNYIG